MAEEQQQQPPPPPQQQEQHDDQPPTVKTRFNNRPESTIAQNFAADLDSMFGLGAAEEMNNLSRTVEEKRATVSSGEQTLQQLEARLRETEERLARVSRNNSPSRQPESRGPPQTQPAGTAAGALTPNGGPRVSPLAQRPTYPADRPPTADSRPAAERADTGKLMAGMPGALPETAPPPPQHYGGSNEYVMVDRNAGQAQRGYG